MQDPTSAPDVAPSLAEASAVPDSIPAEPTVAATPSAVAAQPGLAEKLIDRLNPTLIVALVALGVVVWQWSDTQKTATNLRLELSSRLIAQESANKQSQVATRQLEIERDAVNTRLALLEGKVNEAQNQQQTLTMLYQDLSQHRDRLLLAEIEQMLLSANQQLLVAGNPRAALIALDAAQTRLIELNRPQFGPLTKAITQDIDSLKQLPETDLSNWAVKLDELIIGVANLPLVIDLHPAGNTLPPNTVESPPAPWYKRLPTTMWGEIKQLVRIRRLDKVDAPLLPAEQAYFVRENIKLRLISARTALLSHDGVALKADLGAVDKMLVGYFDSRASNVQHARAQIKQLNDTELDRPLPLLTRSQSALSNLKALKDITSPAPLQSKGSSK